MRLLFQLDAKDYDETAERTIRRSSCGIVIRGREIAMCFIESHGVYVIPGGKVEDGETGEQALIREMHEETGLRIIPESIREYGWVRNIRKGRHEPVFVADDYYYLCDAESRRDAVCLTENETENGYRFDFVSPFDILSRNRRGVSGGLPPCLFERDRQMLEQLIREGFFS